MIAEDMHANSGLNLHLLIYNLWLKVVMADFNHFNLSYSQWWIACGCMMQNVLCCLTWRVNGVGEDFLILL